MRWFYKLPLRFRSLFCKAWVDHEVSAKLRFHQIRSATVSFNAGSRKLAIYAGLPEGHPMGV